MTIDNEFPSDRRMTSRLGSSARNALNLARAPEIDLGWNIRSGEPKQASTDVAGVEICNESYTEYDARRNGMRSEIKPEAARSRASEDAALWLDRPTWKSPPRSRKRYSDTALKK